MASWSLSFIFGVIIMRYHYEKPSIFLSMLRILKRFFDKRAGKCINNLYPTVTIRQIMWALKMKHIPRKLWETCFDRRSI